MKRLSIITAILFLAFALNAQSNRSRSERARSSEPERKERVTRSSNSNRSERSKASQSNKSSRKRDANVNSSSRSRSERNNREVTPRNRNNSRQVTPRDRNSNRQANPRTPSRQYDSQERRSQNRSDVRVDKNPRYQNRESGNTRRRPEHYNPSRNERVEKAKRNENRDRTYRPKTGHRYEAKRRSYTYRPERRVVRPAPKVHYSHKPIEYRRKHYIYRVPPRRTIVWNHSMYREYVYLYPEFKLWYYPIGYRIPTISAYDAGRYIGDVARVYGEIYDVWYSSRTREYYLYIGGPYPYQDFTVVLDRNDARRFSWWPERFFTSRHIEATGLISIFEGKPEMFLKKRSQLRVY